MGGLDGSDLLTNFVGPRRKGGGNPSYCGCTLTHIENGMDLATFVELDQQARTIGVVPPVLGVYRDSRLIPKPEAASPPSVVSTHA